jgi:hypothetical protein
MQLPKAKSNGSPGPSRNKSTAVWRTARKRGPSSPGSMPCRKSRPCWRPNLPASPLASKTCPRRRDQALVWFVLRVEVFGNLVSASPPAGFPFACIQACSLAFALLELPNPTRAPILLRDKQESHFLNFPVCGARRADWKHGSSSPWPDVPRSICGSWWFPSGSGRRCALYGHRPWPPAARPPPSSPAGPFPSLAGAMPGWSALPAILTHNGRGATHSPPPKAKNLSYPQFSRFSCLSRFKSPLSALPRFGPFALAVTMQWKRNVCLVFLRKGFVVRRFQIHKGYAARRTPRLAQKSTAQPLAFPPHGFGLAPVAAASPFLKIPFGILPLSAIVTCSLNHGSRPALADASLRPVRPGCIAGRSVRRGPLADRGKSSLTCPSSHATSALPPATCCPARI